MPGTGLEGTWKRGKGGTRRGGARGSSGWSKFKVLDDNETDEGKVRSHCTYVYAKPYLRWSGCAPGTAVVL